MKSRQTRQILQDEGVQFEVIEYLKNPPSKEELKDLIDKLDIKPEELVRKNEGIFKEMYKGKELSDDEWIDAMLEYPKLIERPIVVDGDKAVIGRPPENVMKLL
jgi:arsenate reductase